MKLNQSDWREMIIVCRRPDLFVQHRKKKGHVCPVICWIRPIWRRPVGQWRDFSPKTSWMLGQMHLSPPSRTRSLLPVLPYLPLFSHCNVAAKNSDTPRHRDAEDVSGPTLFQLLCPVSIQPHTDMHPLWPVLSFALCSAQMSTQFTAHTKLDQFSGVLCRLRTCCLS